jgi:hypothetical protein
VSLRNLVFLFDSYWIVDFDHRVEAARRILEWNVNC